MEVLNMRCLFASSKKKNTICPSPVGKKIPEKNAISRKICKIGKKDGKDRERRKDRGPSQSSPKSPPQKK